MAYQPQAGDYVTMAPRRLGNDMYDRSYCDDVWHVLAVNDLSVCLIGQKGPFYDKPILFPLEERQLCPAPDAMIRAMWGDIAADAAAERANMQQFLAKQLSEIAGL